MTQGFDALHYFIVMLRRHPEEFMKACVIPSSQLWKYCCVTPAGVSPSNPGGRQLKGDLLYVSFLSKLLGNESWVGHVVFAFFSVFFFSAGP